MTRRATKAAVVAAALAAAALGGYWYAREREMPGHAPAAGQAAAPAPAERKVLYWYDPMYPQSKFDKPGKSPFMDMQLVPKYADEQSEAGTVSVSPQAAQNLGVRTAEAKMGSLQQRLEAVGSVAYNERNVVQLQARAQGFVEKLHARAPLDPVAKGAPLVEILFPEWAGAQEEYLLLRRNPSADLRPIIAAARQRLLLLGMTEADIARVEREGRTSARMTLASPITGVVAELGVREGMTVNPGMTLFRIVDLSTVWVNAEVPETQAALVRPGSRVTAQVAAYPEEKFEGRVGAILPEVSATTRTLRTRIELANPGTRLKPGMFASVFFEGNPAKDAVLVPSEAVIRTGERSHVIVALEQGRFRAVEVEPGAEGRGQTEIRKGLKAGDKVVLSGQFLIDSEASLSAALSRLEGAAPAAAGAPTHKGTGTVRAVDAPSGYVELDHDPIASMQWPQMVMGFYVEDKAQLGRLKAGDKVEFDMYGKPNKEGDFILRRIGPASAGRTAREDAK